MSLPKVSICIPTYNRAGYLDWQLSQFLNFKEKIQDWEFVISSNGIEDNTSEIIKKYASNLNINFHEFSKNMGAETNFKKTISLSNSDLIIYLADDDFLDVETVNFYLDLFKGSNNLSAVFAPWQYLNAVDFKLEQQWYYQKDDFIVRRKDYLHTIEVILENKIFPEIYIIKKNIAEKFFSQTPIAFEHFVWCAQIVNSGDIIFAKQPFYLSITKHPSDGNTQRIQNGNIIAQTSWDRYRGGFELILGLARLQKNLSEKKLNDLTSKLHAFVNERMVTALRLNLLSGHFIDSYWIYIRLISNIGEFRVSEEFTLETISHLASLEYALKELQLDSVYLNDAINLH
jgi:glycosyltransferase involved in cell wall biosynthesis